MAKEREEVNEPDRISGKRKGGKAKGLRGERKESRKTDVGKFT